MMSRNGILNPTPNPTDGPLVTVYRRSVYGRLLTYCVDPEHTRRLETLTRRKTLEDADVDALRALGVRVVYDQHTDPDTKGSPA